jgi:hypothetical protein
MLVKNNLRFLFALTLLSLLGCSPQHSPPSKSLDEKTDTNIDHLVDEELLNPEEKAFEHIRWAAKASLFLRGNKELSPEADDIESLKLMSKEDIVESYLKDLDFYKTVADFSLFYIGFRQEFLFNGDLPNTLHVDFPQVVYAIHSLEKDQSYFNLFNTHPALYSLPFSSFAETAFNELGIPPPESSLLLPQKRKIFYDQIIDLFEKAIQATPENYANYHGSLCTIHSKINFFIPLDYGPVDNQLGIPSSLFFSLKQQFLPSFFICNQTFDTSAIFVLKNNFEGYIPFFKTLKELSQIYDPGSYQPQTILDLISVPESLVSPRLVYQNPNIAFTIPNSSTNRNRKRSSYILKHFFCDDLTPVNVELPSEHSDIHGNNPACFACHYKLDPMAGFFKDLGFVFTDFSQSDEILFDDGKQVEKNEYQKPWLKANGSPLWNIGYIQSTHNDQLNTYGETIEDLHTILKTSPEVKKCFVKRALQYATDPAQVFDPGYIEKLTQTYLQEEKTSPQMAFKNLFKQIALSKTFQKNNRDPNLCYDLKPGVSEKNRPPCEVASILENSCVKCHSGNAAANGVDFSQWIKLSDNKMGFPHKKNNQWLSKKESFLLIEERLTTSDPKRRMPPGDMNPVYRQNLYKWLKQEE